MSDGTERSRIGLVLEGGAMRALFTAGVLDAMMEEQLRFDGIVGVSAGAAFGCNYKSGQIGRVLRYNLRFCRDHRYCSWRSWLRTGDLFGADFCYHELPETLDPFDGLAFAKDPTEFYLVCTDVTTGEACYHRCDRADVACFEWMRASASMPLVSRIVEVEGGRYLDGAIADAVPLRFFEEQGYAKNVVILTRPAGYLKTPSSAMPLLKIAYRRYPALLQKLAERHLRYNEAVRYAEEQAEAGKVLLIRPPETLPIDRVSHDRDRIERTYAAGRAEAARRMSEIRAFLAR